MNLQTYIRGMLAVVLGAVLLASPLAFAGTADKQKKQKEEGTEQSTEKSDAKGGAAPLRVPTRAYEVLRNKVSNIEFYSSNYGIFGLNVQANSAGGTWPRGSRRAYIFGGGVWFGAEKKRENGEFQKLCVIGYNPNSGASWMVPGAINGPVNKSPIDETADGINKYRLYMSSDYSSFTGEPFDKADVNGPNWPIWDVNPNDTLKFSRYFGYYIEDVNLRNRSQFAKGPAMISGEDIFSIYKDTDLSKYEKISRDTAKKKGYPIGIQVEQTVYTWGFGDYGNFLFIKYAIINKSGEDLYNCYMAPALDMDIGTPSNDRATIAIPNADDDSLNLAIQWSDRESSGKYGYIGLDFLESPAVDNQGFVRKDKRVFQENEQVGLSVFQNWPIEEDPQTPEQRYEFISDKTQRDVDIGPGDRRFLMSTGPFNMHPGDTARVVVGIMFAYGLGDVPTGEDRDRKNIYAIDKFAQKVYDENFLAPVPPDPANVTWKALNEGVRLSWDEQSERSLDRQERGLDFLGYTIKRGRRTVGFPEADSTDGWNLGFKTVGTFRLPAFPDTLSRMLAARTKNLSYLGAWSRLPMLADTIAGMRLTARRKTRVDTLKRPGQADTLIASKDTTSVSGYYYDGAKFDFDAYDDRDEDSSRYNDGRYGDKFKNKAIRDIVRDAITSIMDSVTNGRTFIDIGDDNADGRIEVDESNLAQNERLINNVDYYYQVLAYDAGSEEGTPSKSNSAIIGINEVRTTPEQAQAGCAATAHVVSSEGMGGIYNFRFNILDNERLCQLFGGDTIEFEWQPARPTQFLPAADQLAGFFFPMYFYVDQVTARSVRTGAELLRFGVPYGQYTDRSDTTLRLLDSGFTTRKTDTGVFVARNVMSTFNDSYNADPLRSYLGTVGVYKNTFGVGFDYTFQQFGDSLRFGVFGDNTYKASPFTINAPSGADANVGRGKVVVGQSQTATSSVILQGIPSIGQAKIEIEFKPGGTEVLTFNKNNKDYSVTVPYLNVEVRNIASFDRDVVDASGNVVKSPVQYNYSFRPDPNARLKADTTNPSYDMGRVIDRGSYGLFAFGWINADKMDSAQRRSLVARGRARTGATGYPGALGATGRYYLGTNSFATDSALRFTHSLVVNGAEIFLDFAGMGNINQNVIAANLPAQTPRTDFAAGDKITVSFTGGTLGLPQPGAKVRVAIPEATPKLDQYTDDLLEQIQIVPNPYLVNHIGQPSNTERRLYFTRLPEKCTIELYTESGELLQTLTHDASTNTSADGQVGVEIWDILTKANRQTQSQLIIARITTPNGAETIKKVAIVVGGFRLNNR